MSGIAQARNYDSDDIEYKTISLVVFNSFQQTAILSYHDWFITAVTTNWFYLQDRQYYKNGTLKVSR